MTTSTSPAPRYDVAGIGNAIVDVLAYTEDSFLEKQELTKGAMILIDEGRADFLYQQMGPATECSGGSAANTLAGLASLGAKTAFIGKVKDDQLGKIFRHDMKAIGVDFHTPAAISGKATARCLICVTPDAQRTMNTYIGACAEITEADIEPELVQGAAITYVEGYLWDLPQTKNALRHAMSLARHAGRKVAFTLSDTFCVERHRAEFLALIREQVNIVFSNESEIKALFETSDLNHAIAQAKGLSDIVIITRGGEGCIVLTPEQMLMVPALKVERVVDTTGAGDLFASGFLYGLVQGKDLRNAAVCGHRCAAEIIQQLGARSLRPLKTLVA
jgi:sugar/nucleoside kinase (ribokinase family)